MKLTPNGWAATPLQSPENHEIPLPASGTHRSCLKKPIWLVSRPMAQNTGVGIGDFSLPFEYAELLITFASDQGVPASTLLTGTGLTIPDLLSQPRYIRSDSYSTLAGNLCAATGDPLLPWKFGRLLSLQPHGMFGLTLRSATRLSKAYEYLPEFFSTRTGGSQVLQTRRDTETFDILIKSGNRNTPDRVVQFHTIASLVNMAWISRTLTGISRTELSDTIFLVWPAPSQDGWTAYLPPGTRTVFNHKESYFSLPLAMMRLRVRSGGKQFNSAAVSKLRQELSLPPETMDIVGRVGWAIHKTGFKGSTIETASELLGVSPATLKRRLGEKGETFLAVKNAQRFGVVRDLLRSTTLSLDEIAYRAGYENSSNLSKAFRRNFGISPGVYRKSLSKY
ncbi:helix-turn-helix domain-containing protein [Leisingera sp. HS039]|uniref:AraC family transcriptional regulator n=1 Tax=unclassified Leisingera TaxID=2614906 RepID=UPI0010714EB0|nr:MULTISPECIES: AraC family transcriptional regulator [unclassified Leisingera]MBQ4826314.1 helix-turn-helix domain-containing protein [Leisingera sp. HS039]QBR37849.1 AraC family transcriptional regulator [Leisingera sp. NJS201]